MPKAKYVSIFAVVAIAALGYSVYWFAKGPGPANTPEPTLNKPPAAGTSYDLIVVGSDPEGIAAAVSAARNGLSTLLVDTRPELGGLMTRGWLNTLDMNYAPNGEVLNKGIFLEVFDQLEGASFDVNTALSVFNRLVENEPNLSVRLGVDAVRPLSFGVSPHKQITGVAVVDNNTTTDILCRMVIDATQDADLAAAAGVPFSVGQSDIGREGRKMAVTEVFQLKGMTALDWLKAGIALTANRLSGKSQSGISRESAWGFGDLMTEYQPMNDQVGMRGLNIGRQRDGTVLVNALQIFGIDPLDKGQRKEAKLIATAELPHIVDFLRSNVPGFEHVQLVATAPELYVRESRHIDGEYRLTVDDVLENRDFADAVALGSYPIDIQAVDRDFNGTIVGSPKEYGIPLRCLIPLDVDALMVVGRSASFDSLAGGSARVIPVGMAAGQAAGAAAAMCLEDDISIRTLAADHNLVEQLRRRLNDQGMEIKHFSYPVPETDHWAYPGLELLRRYGLVFGGYDNDYDLDGEIEEQRFMNLLSWVSKLAHGEGDDKDNNSQPLLIAEGNDFTIEDISYMISQYLGTGITTKKEAYRYLMERHFYTDEVLNNIQKNGGKITNGAAYMILKGYFDQIRARQETSSLTP